MDLQTIQTELLDRRSGQEELIGRKLIHGKNQNISPFLFNCFWMRAQVSEVAGK
jgi:hypothetical protein